MIERPDEILWDLPRADAADDERVPSDGRLRAWRAGELSELEARRTEWALSRSARARERLVALSGVRLATPPPRVRRRIVGSPAWVPEWRPSLRWLYPAAAALLLAVLASVLLPLRPPAGPVALPPGAAFDVAVLGQAVTRDVSGPPATRPDGTVRILIEPRGAAIAGVEFGVYVEREARLVRLGPADGVVVDSRRGAATLVADARALTGAAGSGTHEFYVVVGPNGRLPAGVDLLAGDARAARLAAESGGRAYRRTVTIRPDESRLDSPSPRPEP